MLLFPQKVKGDEHRPFRFGRPPTYFAQGGPGASLWRGPQEPPVGRSLPDWVSPFPTTEPSYSPFLEQLAQEAGDFAVADSPMGRQASKYYLFFQTIHGKKIIGGVVSRTPDDAYAFVKANPLLSAMRNANVPNRYIRERLAVLSALDIRYVIVHKRFLDAQAMALWQRWLVHFPTPFYEDDMVIVYRTRPTPDLQAGLSGQDVHRLEVRLGERVRLLGYRTSSSAVSAGDALTVTLFWQADDRLAKDYHVFVHLLNAEGELVAQHDGVPVNGERPTWSWWGGEVIRDAHELVIGADLPGGAYTLSAGVYDFATGERLPAFGPSGERRPDDRVLLERVRVTSP